MVFRSQLSFLVIIFVLTSLLAACGGSEPDSKLGSVNESVSSEHSLSGVALDGYLKNAKVCLDLNQNWYCDSDDGASVLTGSAGEYTLPVISKNLARYSIIVEAVPHQTIDMDNPNTKLDRAFVLSAPASHGGLVTPFTSLMMTIAEQGGTDFETAKQILAKLLGIDAGKLMVDYVAGQERIDKELHLLAQALTKIMQSGEQASVKDGVSTMIARQGTRAKLSLLDFSALKNRTDKLVGVSHTEAMNEIVRDYSFGMALSSSEIVANRVFIIPSSPKNGLVNDDADTFSWRWLGHFTDIKDYQYSLDAGQSWQDVIAVPLYVGNGAFNPGSVQVRIRADHSKKRQAGLPVLSNKAFTQVFAPSSPASLTMNDRTNHFDWQFIPEYTEYSAYEYSVDAGVSWLTVTAKPQPIEDIAIDLGSLQLRLAERMDPHTPAGQIISSTAPFTTTPARPVAPIILSVNDEHDSFRWEPLAGFSQGSDYEVYLDGAWRQAKNNPEFVGNKSYLANSLKIRVQFNEANGMEAGMAAVISQAFTHNASKPAAARNGQVDDINDTFDWDYVSGFTAIEHYEISTDTGQTWGAAMTKPAVVGGDELAIAQVYVRVRANAIGSHVAGEILHSLATFTLTPSRPDAPTKAVSNDILDTFAWQWTTGFEKVEDYEIKTPDQDWSTVKANPHQLPVENTYQVGDVQVRVKADVLTDRLPSLALVNLEAYTINPTAADAPTHPEIVNASGVKITNGLKWRWVSGFTEAVHYEYSHDGGVSWTTASSNPQHIGSEVYAKDKVLIRVRANAKDGEANLPSKVLDASSASGEFIAMEFVPMQAVGQVVGLYEYYNEYRFYDNEVCWAQFDAKGEGEPIYWGNKKRGLNKSGVINDLSLISQDSMCGLTGWDAAPDSLVNDMTASGEKYPIYMYKGHGSFWAKSGTDYVIYNSGAIWTGSNRNAEYYPYWKLGKTGEVMAQLLKIKDHAITRVNALQNKEITLNTSLLAKMRKTDSGLQDVEKINLDMQALHTQASQLTTELDEAHVDYRLYVNVIISSRPATDSVSLASLATYLDELEAQQTAINRMVLSSQASILSLSVLEYQLGLSLDSSDVINKIAALSTKNDQALHSATLSLYQAIYTLEQTLKGFESIDNTLTEVMDSGALSDALLTELNGLAARLSALKHSAGIVSAKNTAQQALLRAKHEGYLVAKSEAVVGTHFRKLDINGDYLPSNTSYDQGWRCVSDIRMTKLKRIWSLLADGLPGGKDNLPFDDGTDTEDNVMGATGLLQVFNGAHYCGRNDWQVPSFRQINTINTANNNINTNVFPHHLALQEEYNQSRGGKYFYYWLNTANNNDVAQQKAYTFKRSYNNASTAFFDKSIKIFENNVFIRVSAPKIID